MFIWQTFLVPSKSSVLINLYHDWFNKDQFQVYKYAIIWTAHFLNACEALVFFPNFWNFSSVPIVTENQQL